MVPIKANDDLKTTKAIGRITITKTIGVPTTTSGFGTTTLTKGIGEVMVKEIGEKTTIMPIRARFFKDTQFINNKETCLPIHPKVQGSTSNKLDRIEHMFKQMMMEKNADMDAQLAPQTTSIGNLEVKMGQISQGLRVHYQVTRY